MTRALHRTAPLVAATFVALVAYAQLDGLHDLFGGDPGFDFRGTLYEPARRALEGMSPYPSPADGTALASGNPAPYPPVPILAVVPLSQLGFGLALGVWTVLLASAVVGALLAVGVRDWRCHALALLCPPVVQGLYVGNVTLLLMLPLALAWRWRANGIRAGIVLGSGIVVKPLLLPLCGWMLLTRRFMAVCVAAATAVVLAAASWAAIGFDGFAEYSHLLARIEEVYGRSSYSLPSAFWQVADGRQARLGICLLAALVLFGAAATFRSSAFGDIACFVIMVAACVVASPVVWPHYLALLLVPLGIVYPRVALLWLAPYALPLVLGFQDRLIRALGFMAFALLLTVAIVVVARRSTRQIAS